MPSHALGSLALLKYLVLLVGGLLGEVVNLVDDVKQRLGTDFVIGDSLGGSIGLFDERAIVGALDEHHGGAELFLWGLVEMVNKRA